MRDSRLGSPAGIALLLFLFTLVFSWRLLGTGDKVGLGDWQYYTFLWEVSKRTMLDYHQLPLWNPYELGGNIYVAHPNTHFLSPVQLLLLPLDTAVAHKINVVLHLFLSLWGMHIVATRVCGTSTPASLVAAVLFGCAGFFGWRVQGQLEKIGLYLVPWVFYFFALSQTRIRNVLWTALILTLIVLEGGAAYPVAFIVLLLSLDTGYQFFDRKCDLRIVGVLLLSLLAFGLLAAIRLLPILDYLRDYPRVIPSDDRIELPLLVDIYFGRRTMPDWAWPRGEHLYVWWGEYASYLGVPFLCFFLGGIALDFKANRKLAFLCAAFFLLSLGMYGWWAPFEILRLIPPFSGLRVPTRFNVLLFFPLALIVARSIDAAWRHLSARAYRSLWTRRLALGTLALVVAGATADYAYFNQSMWRDAFVNAPLSTFKRPEHRFKQVLAGRQYPYAAPLLNYGVLDLYEEVHIQTSPRLRPDLPSEVYLEPAAAGRVELRLWTPNRLEIDVQALDTNARVLVNMNYDKHWKADGAQVVNHEGLIGLVPTRPAPSLIKLRYLPAPFLVGAAVSGVSLLASTGAYLALRRRERRGSNPSSFGPRAGLPL